MTYYNYSSSTYRRGRSCGPSTPLNVTEMLPLVTSVTQKLQLSPDSDGMNIYTILLDISTDNQVKGLQDAISAGMGVAASSLYWSAIANSHLDGVPSDPQNYTPLFPTVNAVVFYRATGGNKGTRRISGTRSLASQVCLRSLAPPWAPGLDFATTRAIGHRRSLSDSTPRTSIHRLTAIRELYLRAARKRPYSTDMFRGLRQLVSQRLYR